MRSYLPAYELKAPSTLDEALAVMAREAGAWKPFAGGTDLMVLFEAGQLEQIPQPLALARIERDRGRR
jgi:CO/xanthine dehydrogenase FAD-binding subunit